MTGTTNADARPIGLAAWSVRRTQFAIMLVWVGLVSTINSVSVASDLRRHGIAFHAAEPWLWEFSGGLGALLLLWPVLAFDDALRRRSPTHVPRAAAYLLGSVVFSLGHVLLMVSMRELVYRSVGWHYDFGPWASTLLYEYRKDAFSFLLIVAGAAALRRLKARAPVAEPPPLGMVAVPAAPAPVVATLPAATFIVRSPQGDLLVRASEIDWVEAQGNYVALHVGGEVRLLRQTLAETEVRLKPHGFVRSHRRALVNRQRIEAIVAPGAGEPGVRLRGGALAPLSESRRAELLRAVVEA